MSPPSSVNDHTTREAVENGILSFLTIDASVCGAAVALGLADLERDQILRQRDVRKALVDGFERRQDGQAHAFVIERLGRAPPTRGARDPGFFVVRVIKRCLQGCVVRYQNNASPPPGGVNPKWRVSPRRNGYVTRLTPRICAGIVGFATEGTSNLVNGSQEITA